MSTPSTRRTEWKFYTWRFNHGAIAFKLPEGWYSVSEDSIISFSSPSQRSALTITVYTDPPLAFDAIESHILARTPFGASQGRSARVGSPNRADYVEEFRSNRDGREADWIVHFLFLDVATVIASVNSTIQEMARERRTFHEILTSIKVLDATS